MQVYDVKFLDVGKNGNRFYIYFGTDHKTVDDLVKDLQEKVVVSGVRLFWHRENGEVVVDDTTPFAIARGSIYSITIPNQPVARYVE